MKKIDQNLIKEKLPKKTIDEFKNDIKENEIKMKKPSYWQETVVSKYSMIIAGIFFVIGLILITLKLIYQGSNFLMILSIIILTPTTIWICLIYWIRKKLVDNNLKDISIKNIFTKWFILYGIKEEDIAFHITIKKNFLRHIQTKRTSPSDANIDWNSGVYSIICNGIKTSFVSVKWHWQRRVCNSEGHCYTQHYYQEQFFIFDENLDSKWNQLTFSLTRGKEIFNKIQKHETLENDKFNKAFKYKYNDPLKLRRIFTLHTQEILLKHFSNNNLKIFKEKEVVITTCKSRQVARDFNPFQIVISKTLDNAKFKERVASDFAIDFTNLIKTMGHSRLLFSLYKK